MDAKVELIKKVSILLSAEVQNKWLGRNLFLSLNVNHKVREIIITVYTLSPKETKIIEFSLEGVGNEMTHDLSFKLNSELDLSDNVIDDILTTTNHKKSFLKTIIGSWPLVNLSLDDFITRMSR